MIPWEVYKVQANRTKRVENEPKTWPKLCRSASRGGPGEAREAQKRARRLPDASRRGPGGSQEQPPGPEQKLFGEAEVSSKAPL